MVTLKKKFIPKNCPQGIILILGINKIIIKIRKPHIPGFLHWRPDKRQEINIITKNSELLSL